jgi:hypothetical protein
VPGIAKAARREKGGVMVEMLGGNSTLPAVQGVCWLDSDMDSDDMKISSIFSYVLISTLIELLNEVPHLTSA